MTVLLPFRTVVLESPYKATESHSVEQHQVYLVHCLSDARSRWEEPYASHEGLTGDDDDELARQIGIRRGWAIGDKLDACVVYSDFGVTPGMSQSIAHYEQMGKPVEWRKLPASIVKSILEMAG